VSAAAEGAADRIAEIRLDERSIVRWSLEVEHERNVAIFDLIESNSFSLAGSPGPYRLLLSLRESNLVLEVRGPDEAADPVEVVLATRPFRRVIKDYFLICESYLQAIKGATPSRIEAIDMARRGLHDEGSELLREALKGRAEVDHDTARRLFTLVCVLHIRG
jgi:uncharacterized protein (UPF0262 family)